MWGRGRKLHKLVPYYKYLLNITGISIVSGGAPGAQPHVIECNHIHVRDEDDWVCGRTLAFEDRELLRCEARDPDESEACSRCAEQMLAYFGDPMHIQ